jgi:hypothetical protein
VAEQPDVQPVGPHEEVKSRQQPDAPTEGHANGNAERALVDARKCLFEALVRAMPVEISHGAGYQIGSLAWAHIEIVNVLARSARLIC